MITIPLEEQDITQAKEMIEAFDSIKTWNKFSCSTNYIGPLGELALHKYLSTSGVTHTWLPFVKPTSSFNDPDFIINDITYDIKTTTSDYMWIQQPKHDIYIYAQLIDNVIYIKGFMTRRMIEESIDDNSAHYVTRNNRTDYVFGVSEMLSPDWLSIIWRNENVF